MNSEGLALLLMVPLGSFFFVVTVWMFAWIGIHCNLPRVLGRFAAQVVEGYRSGRGR